MGIQIKLEDKESSLILNCDFRDYDHIKWLLETAWDNSYETYIRRLEEGKEDGG